jgi:hypothetical protein
MRHGARPSLRIIVFAVAVLLLGGCFGGDGTKYSGTAVDVDRIDGYWRLQVLLSGGRSITGANEIITGIPVDELVCSEGAPTGGRAPVVGGMIRFTRRGNDADGSSPPGVGARDLVADCAAPA